MDEDRNSRDLIVYAVENSGMSCRGFDDTALFWAAIAEETPDLMIMETVLSQSDGMEILRRLKSDVITAGIPVIIVSGKAEEFDKIIALDAGADDYLVKPFSVLELLSRIRAVLRRFGSGQTKEIRVGELLMNCDSHRVFVGDVEVSLTNREYQLLHYLLAHQGVLIQRDRLLRHVWGFDVQVETRTVDVHIRYLRQKLGKAGNCIETVRGVGYRIGGDR